jgi:hypothetical protein
VSLSAFANDVAEDGLGVGVKPESKLSSFLHAWKTLAIRMLKSIKDNLFLFILSMAGFVTNDVLKQMVC